MAELPESLKKYLPGPLFFLLAAGWWLLGDPMQKWAQEEISHTPVQVRIEPRADHFYLIRVEATRYAEKPFEEVEIQIQLHSKPDDIAGELSARNGSHLKLVIQPTNPAGNILLVENTSGSGGTTTAITLHQRENIEIHLHESASDAVREVWFYSKEGAPISSSDLNQRWPVVKIAWRLGLAILAICALGFLYKLLYMPIVRLFLPMELQKLDRDREFLHSCWQADPAARARFDHDFQPVIDASTDKYLKIFDPAVRESVRKPVIAEQIFRRARSLPKLRRPLKGEVERFVIHFCIQMFEHELEELKQKAKADEARIH
jgi:hypothetical protein